MLTSEKILKGTKFKFNIRQIDTLMVTLATFFHDINFDNKSYSALQQECLLSNLLRSEKDSSFHLLVSL